MSSTDTPHSRGQSSEGVRQGSPEERKSLALSALIIGMVAILCAFIPGWRLFSLIIAIVAIAVAVFCIARARKPGSRAKLALWALACGILAVLITAYFLLTSSPVEATAVEVKEELQEIGPADRGDAIDKLNSATDSTQEQ